MMTAADTMRFDADAMSHAVHALKDYEAENVCNAFIDHVLYILPRAVRHAAVDAMTHDRVDDLAEMVRVAEEAGVPQAWLSDDRDEQARCHMARAQVYVLQALHVKCNEFLADDPFEDYGSIVNKVGTRCINAAGHAIAADACLMTAAPYTEMAEHSYLESLGSSREMAWQCYQVLDN